MTFTQLEYIVAVDTHRHFARAAAHCFVSQPTLSMQIRKAEEELGVLFFDRSKQPVLPTEIGTALIAQARRIIAEKNRLDEMVQASKGLVAGELRMGIIPTLAPYLIPLFVPLLTRKYPKVRLVVKELMTDQILEQLRSGQVDMGLLVTPLQEAGIREHVLFYEELMAYVSRRNAAYRKTYMLPQDIDPRQLWLLEEGHCLRSQIVNLCELRKASRDASHFDYEAGSIETLKHMVDLN
ncbi:MAG TPA: LysR substrate-binding domain-containing protein, partial [Sediminibacterium sp.]|nr:LysR substrate-binding domain-containing protein [Sediminibacterium sp.]